MPAGIYNTYDDEWIVEHWDKAGTIKELSEEYNQVHMVNYTYHAFTYHCKHKLGLQRGWQSFSEEQERWLKENWGEMGGGCVDVFNEKFGTSHSYDTIRTHCRRNGYRCSDTLLSRRGRSNAKKYAPIGTVVEDSGGYLNIKVDDKKDSRNTNWELLHRYVYEQAYGEIPDGKCLIFLDGNNRNVDLSNLAVIPPSHLALLNKSNLRSEDPRITKAAIKWCDLHELLRRDANGK